ncbi:MAG: hypothetical protein ACFCUT_17410 [Kiloniellaceae bacterium]
MTRIERYYEMIGRLLAFLVSQGLAKVTLRSSNAREILSSDGADSDDDMSDFKDVVHWMASERLIRFSSYYQATSFIFSEVQLTSRGISLIQATPDSTPLNASIEKTLTDNAEGGLDASTYTKIGALAGGLLGGFTKSIG